jgi:glycosyltransferase involved in cell wall biosynthesis
MTPPLKVAHVTTVDVGLRYLLFNQLKAIQQAGYQVTGISSAGAEVPLLEAAGIRHIAVPMTRNFTPLADWLSLWRLFRVMRREGFTIVHTHNPKPGLLGQLAARMAGVPVVINTIHGFYFHDNMPSHWRRFYVIVEKVAALCSDSILSQNREDIETALAEGISSPDKIRHLGNGIDLTQFDPTRITPDAIRQARREMGIDEESQVVGFVGRLAARRKGFLDFLAAGREIAQRVPNVRFLIVGGADVGKPDAVEPATAKEYGIADACIFLGQRPNDELPLLYSLMDVFVLPSLFEGLPRAGMEASAMGVPAVLTDVRGNREAVEHNRNGLLVPLGDVAALADAIANLLNDRERARQMGEEGRRLAEERFDERLVFEKVKSEYARLLVEKRTATPWRQSVRIRLQNKRLLSKRPEGDR